MPLITIIIFVVCLGTLVLLSVAMKNKKKLAAAKAYGLSAFDIELPATATIRKGAAERTLPQFNSSSDAGAFFRLVTPYLGSLSKPKREYVRQTIEDLKTDLKIDKEIYRYFINEYNTYDGLSDEQAAEKWSLK